MLISPLFPFKANHTLNKINLEQNTPNFKGQIKSDTFEKTSKTPKLKRGQILNNDGTILNVHGTEFFRYDIDWNKFSEYLKERYKDYDKVNIYDYACSNGSEAYSLSILLQHKFKDDAEKFFPIYAKDIDEDLIAKNLKEQKTGKVNCEKDILTMTHAIDMSEEDMKRDFITSERDFKLSCNEQFATLTKKVTKPVIFSEANILDDIENIDDKNPSVVMCRNMWLYVDSKEYQKFADDLYKKLAKNSTVVLGGFDLYCEENMKDSDKISKALLNAGFEPSDTNKNGCDLIFEKN